MPRQLQAQESTTTAQTRHYGADGDVERFCRFAVAGPLDIHEHDQRPQVFRQAAESRLHGFGGQGVGCWHIDEQRRLAGGVEIDEKRLARALAVLGRIREQQDLVEPGAAIGAGFEAMKRTPGLQICLLQQVLACVGTAAEPAGNAKELRYVHQSCPVEFFTPVMRDAKHREVAIVNVRKRSIYSGNRSKPGGHTASVCFGTVGRSPLRSRSAERSAMNRFSLVLAIAVLGSGSAAAVIGAQAKPTPTYESALSRSWEEIHNKILTMAKDTVFPDAKLGWKPHPDSRSVLDELRHVTIGLEMTTAEAKGEKFDFDAREKADVGKPKTRASVGAEMG